MGPKNSKPPVPEAGVPPTSNIAILSAIVQGEKGVGENMIVVSMKPFGATTKFPSFLLVGALNVSFCHQDNCLNINSEATVRQPETPAI